MKKTKRAMVTVCFMWNYYNCDKIKVWNLQQMKEQGRIELGHDFHATTIMHPDTYLNKVLIGSSQGYMALFNLRSKVP